MSTIGIRTERDEHNSTLRMTAAQGATFENGKRHLKVYEVNRMTNLHHTTKVDSLQLALGALGRRLEMALV
ncbi:hypothetical protein [Variovorax sp. LjRoot84]|uniref:hypothetical protein n=1 Tax=Variovorax sp. LjRoot84 TaxID=3342340 RepID=UPI003F51245B